MPCPGNERDGAQEQRQSGPPARRCPSDLGCYHFPYVFKPTACSAEKDRRIGGNQRSRIHPCRCQGWSPVASSPSCSRSCSWRIRWVRTVSLISVRASSWAGVSRLRKSARAGPGIRGRPFRWPSGLCRGCRRRRCGRPRGWVPGRAVPARPCGGSGGEAALLPAEGAAQVEGAQPSLRAGVKGEQHLVVGQGQPAVTVEALLEVCLQRGAHALVAGPRAAFPRCEGDAVAHAPRVVDGSSNGVCRDKVDLSTETLSGTPCPGIVIGETAHDRLRPRTAFRHLPHPGQR